MDEAVLDAPVEETPDAALEAPEGGEAEQPTEGAVEGTPEAPAAEAAPAALVVNGKDLAPDVKNMLAEVGKTNPALARAMRTALFQADRIQRELPGGFKELAQLKGLAETLGGEHGVQSLTSELNGWHEFDQQFTAGDPKALEFMLGSPEGQDAFLKLAPVAFGKYAELHPEGFQNYICNLFMNDMVQARLPLDLERLADFIGDDPKGKAVYDRICGYVNSISGAATKPVTPRKGAQPDTASADLQTREQNLTREEWRRETAQDQQPIFEAEWSRLAAGRKIGDAQTAAIRELFQNSLGRAIKTQEEKLNRYFQNKDREGFRRMAQSISKAEIPKALRSAFDAVLPAKPGPRPGTPGVVKPGQVPVRPIPGFQTITGMPARDSIDYTHPFNTPANFSAGKAVLKDGKKVTWQR